ncbi:MAG TPA: hypothetical protein VK876_11990, partial [Rubrivivax sp.]|nr:hypothetical protein [Rubrivivax sp.]
DAAERVTSLATTGRISRAGLRALRDEIDRARRAIMKGQQVARLASGRVRVSHERLDLTALLHESVRARAREIHARGIELRQQLAPTEVRSDAALLPALLAAVLDWCFEHACTVIELKLAVPGWPARAQLRAGFGYRAADELVTAAAPLDVDTDPALDTLSWRLLQQTAAVMGLEVWRRDTQGRTGLTLGFPDTLAPSLQTLFDPGAPAVNSQPHAGRHVLALAPQRELRGLVREALRPMGVLLDFVATVDEARQLCASGLPHVVVYEAALAGPEFERLSAEWRTDAPRLGFVRIVDQGRAFEVLNLGIGPVACVGRDAIIESLPAALHFELARAD